MKRKPKVNEAAGIINSMFLDSPYEGKDWEAVRKDLIKVFSSRGNHFYE